MATLYIRKLEDGLHQKIKAIAALEGKSLEAKITELVEKETVRFDKTGAAKANHRR